MYFLSPIYLYALFYIIAVIFEANRYVIVRLYAHDCSKVVERANASTRTDHVSGGEPLQDGVT